MRRALQSPNDNLNFYLDLLNNVKRDPFPNHSNNYQKTSVLPNRLTPTAAPDAPNPKMFFQSNSLGFPSASLLSLSPNLCCVDLMNSALSPLRRARMQSGKPSSGSSIPGLRCVRLASQSLSIQGTFAF